VWTAKRSLSAADKPKLIRLVTLPMKTRWIINSHDWI